MAKTKVNFFEAEKALSTSVVEFFFCVVKRDELRVTYTRQISAIEMLIEETNKKIGQLEKGVLVSSKSAKDYMAEIQGYQTKIEEIRTEWEAMREKFLTFEWSEAAKLLKKNITKAENSADVLSEIRAFFKAYNLEIANTDFENRCVEAVGFKISNKKLANSNGTQCLVYDGNKGAQAIYGVAFEAMVQAGTIKAVQIPEILRDKYAKKSTKKSKKTSK